MTQDAQLVMDEFTEICRKAGSTVYNQGVVDGLVNLKNLINENKNLTLDELKDVIDVFIKKNTIGDNTNKDETPNTVINSSAVEEAEEKENKEEVSVEPVLDFSKTIPIEGINPNVQDMINKKNEELTPNLDPLSMISGMIPPMM